MTTLADHSHISNFPAALVVVLILGGLALAYDRRVRHTTRPRTPLDDGFARLCDEAKRRDGAA